MSGLSSSAIEDCVNKDDMLWNGRYLVKKEIGKGQYGKVFLARDINRLFNGNATYKKKVAIKVLLKDKQEESDSDDGYEHEIF